MNGAQCIIQELKKQNVKTVFGYPGGAIMPLYDALYNEDIEHILCRHEQGAAMAAIGYARATGKVGVCIATSGPGATNLITGLADAMVDSVPIIAITGQVPLPLIGTDAFQEIDIIGMSLSCTKHSFLITSSLELAKIIKKSFFIAVSNRPGPVLIDIPKDIQLSELPKIIKLKNKKKIHINKKKYSKKKIKEANFLLKKSNMPILYIGGGVNIGNAVYTLRKFVKISKIPTVVTLKGLGTINNKHPYHLGMLGMHGNKAANYTVQKCDLLIAIGARFDDRVTGNIKKFAPYAKIIHMDIDPAEINKICKVNVELLGDLNLLIPLLKKPKNILKWQNYIKKIKKKYSYKYNFFIKNNKIYAPFLLKKLSDIKSKKTIITTDVGQHQMWTAQHITFSNPKNFITSSGLGTMGFGIPAAIGAQIAKPDNNVICISGDGSFIMNIQELSTIKRKNLPIKIILLDNKRLGMVRQWQELFFKKRYSETTLYDNPDFIKLAKSFGISGHSISHENEVDKSLKKIFSVKKPYILHVLINEYDNVWPLVPPGYSNDNMIEKN
ncbi:acetolactate synthase 2 catalytic subunit [Enterobacteriaceae endosymbiont of Donacia bicoloricornis]|uniref:acetolactate synthase 2 catalytic subunit n=1 Tax=Enterobacteriaceae endosymbiont of Donacia bicoloricornis TaxID=2675772 RepID=UPI0014498F46|nr:acetolactate synthase 2 catalytic subunit [Enterobacteriaceae endosymbiont of Donacia bicoloricornis]QJC37719.1 acetolactate synthase 2 catalytic subunit [Enterobacteriaceae endosymbiont of Donacia bicoloricornis]